MDDIKAVVLEGVVEQFPVTIQKQRGVGIDVTCPVLEPASRESLVLPGANSLGAVIQLDRREIKIPPSYLFDPLLMTVVPVLAGDGAQQLLDFVPALRWQTGNISVRISGAVSIHGPAHLFGCLDKSGSIVPLNHTPFVVHVHPCEKGLVRTTQSGAMTQWQSIADKFARTPIENPAKKALHFFEKITIFFTPLIQGAYVIHLVDHTGKSLMRPGIGIDMHGDPQPVQAVQFAPFQDTGAHHIPGHITVRTTDKFLDEAAAWIFSSGFTTIARQKMKGNPHVMTGEFIEVTVIQRLVRNKLRCPPHDGQIPHNGR